MTSWQKAIKYAAMAFALLLVVGIVGSIIGALSVFSFIFDKTSPIGDMQTYIPNGDIADLVIDIGAAELNVIKGDKLYVEYNHKNLTVNEKSEKLTIKENSKGFTVYNETAVVNLYLPEGISFGTADISTGAGRVVIDTLTCDRLALDLGAGETVIDRLDIEKSADINGGAGKFTVIGGSIWNLDLEMGVGKLELTAELLGNSDIDFGVGDANLTLIGSSDDYIIDLDKGIGNASVDGDMVKNDKIIGSGTKRIEIDGGVGSIDVTFTE